MTCIVGIEENGKVYMGGDSAATAGYDTTILDESKVFIIPGDGQSCLKGDFLIGCSGSSRAAQLLRHRLSPPISNTTDEYRYLVTSFIDSVRDCLKIGGHAEKKSEQESTEVDFLLGWRGKLWRICTDYQVHRRTIQFQATGSGYAYALGAMHVTTGKPPRERIDLALRASEEFNAGVRGPFTVMDI